MKFKVGDKVRNIITGNVGKVKCIEKTYLKDKFVEEVDKKLGIFNRIYFVSYPEGFSRWQSIVEIEKVPEILDEKEKEYLSIIIKPFKERVNYIEKMSIFNNEFIIINVKNYKSEINNNDNLILPEFKRSTMYKNMELRKQYTLKELNLE